MMQDASDDAERARRELMKMDLGQVRIEGVMDDTTGQPAISAHWRVSYAGDDFDPQSDLAEAERVARAIDSVLQGYGRRYSCIRSVEGVVQVSVIYE